MTKANLYEGMPSAKVEKILEKVHDEIYSCGLENSYRKIEKIYQKNMHFWDMDDSYDTQSSYDECGVDFEELEDCFVKCTSERHMKIECGAVENGKRYYVLYFEAYKEDDKGNRLDEVEYVEQCRCPIVEVDGHDMVSWQFINKIRELTYLGFRMVQSKEYEFLKLNGV